MSVKVAPFFLQIILGLSHLLRSCNAYVPVDPSAVGKVPVECSRPRAVHGFILGSGCDRIIVRFSGRGPGCRALVILGCFLLIMRRISCSIISRYFIFRCSAVCIFGLFGRCRIARAVRLCRSGIIRAPVLAVRFSGNVLCCISPFFYAVIIFERIIFYGGRFVPICKN